jgi:hypothetical protein
MGMGLAVHFVSKLRWARVLEEVWWIRSGFSQHIRQLCSDGAIEDLLWSKVNGDPESTG